jgi:hypothetical protein
MKHAVALCALVVASACSKGTTGEAPAPPASVAVPESAAAPAKSAPTPAASAAGVTKWKGGYKSVAGSFVLPKDVKWKVPDSPAGIGDGTIALTIDAGTGRVQGTIDGPLGPATVDGLAVGGKVTANVARTDPTDHGFTGTLQGTLGDSLQGTMNLAQADVTAVRNATFDLAPAR